MDDKIVLLQGEVKGLRQEINDLKHKVKLLKNIITHAWEDLQETRKELKNDKDI